MELDQTHTTLLLDLHPPTPPNNSGKFYGLVLVLLSKAVDIQTLPKQTLNYSHYLINV